MPLSVYLEDTDAQGIVYHANYLKYCERTRADLLCENGYTLGAMQQSGVRFVVYEMHLKYLSPARLHDQLEVRTTAKRTSDYRLVFAHEVYRGTEPSPLFSATATVVTIDNGGELCPLPEDLLVD